MRRIVPIVALVLICFTALAQTASYFNQGFLRQPSAAADRLYLGITNGAGPPGPIGPAGPTGPTGLTGSAGPTGPAGANGTSGTNGVNGTNGLNGASGTNVTSGLTTNFLLASDSLSADRLYFTNGVLTAISNSYPNITSGLVGWWRLDDGSGTLAADSSFNGFSGTLVNTPVWTNGLIKGAVNFVQASSQYVSLGSPTLFPSVGNFTITAWVYVTGGTGSRTVFSDHDDNVYLAIDSTGRPLTWLFVGGYTSLTFNSVMSAGWHFLALIKSSVTGTTLYYDLSSTNNAAITGSVTFAAPYAIGAQANATLFWNGMLDDVRVYNRALGTPEIINLFNWRP